MDTFRKAKITTRAVEALRPGETMADTALPGYCVRRQKGDDRVYFVRKQAGGQRQFVTIGRHGCEGWTETKARAAALNIIAALRQGKDPRTERAKLRGMPTVAEYAAEHLEKRCAALKPRTVDNYRGLLTKHIAPPEAKSSLGMLRLDHLREEHVAELHRSLKGTPRAANHCVQFLRVVFRRALGAGLLPAGSNPAAKITLYRIEPRQRFLTETELCRVGEVFAEFEATNSQDPFPIAAIRLLLFTGCRKNEILKMRWDWLDIERGILNLPDAKRGARPVLLSAAALQVLATLPRIAGNPHVIVGHNGGDHWKNLQEVWVRIRNKAKLPSITLADGRTQNVRIHDLRHSFAAMTAANGASLLMIGKLLGHRNPHSTMIYAHLLDDPLRRLSDAVGARTKIALMPKRSAA